MAAHEEQEKEQDYSIPDNYENLDELAAPSPVENVKELRSYTSFSLEESRSRRGSGEGRRKSHDFLDGRSKQDEEARRKAEGENTNLTELSAPAPVDREEPDEPTRSHDQRSNGYTESKPPLFPRWQRVSSFATKLYTISYLILFSIFGTLARLGLQAITTYPSAPSQLPVLWANFTGSIMMGFLSEDRALFRSGYSASRATSLKQHRTPSDEEKKNTPSEQDAPACAKLKKTIPLYIGLTTGFCGSLTSFSSFMRDAFLALANSLPIPVSHSSPSPTTLTDVTATLPRSGGYSFMALLAVLILTVTVCLSALQLGAHIALASAPYLPAVHPHHLRTYIDRAIVPFAFAIWFVALLLSIFPPNPTWRSILLALTFAPLGCLLRFYMSLALNPRIPSFPLGTFIVNIFGTLIGAMCYDLQHVPLGSMIRCQVLQGVMDGFCGCATTVSTWVMELKGLRRKSAYVYGGASLGVGLGLSVAVMGGLRWSVGFARTVCAG